MKRLVGVTLALCLTVLVGCGGTSNNNFDPNQNPGGFCNVFGTPINSYNNLFSGILTPIYGPNNYSNQIDLRLYFKEGLIANNPGQAVLGSAELTLGDLATYFPYADPTVFNQKITLCSSAAGYYQLGTGYISLNLSDSIFTPPPILTFPQSYPTTYNSMIQIIASFGSAAGCGTSQVDSNNRIKQCVGIKVGSQPTKLYQSY